MQCSLDPEENLAKAEDRCRQAAARGAQIVCLPELFRSQYFCREEDARLFDLAEPIPGPSTERLASIARQENVVIIASLFERAGYLSQYGGGDRNRGRDPGTVPEDA